MLNKKEIFHYKDSIYIRLGSWKGRSLPSRRSIVKFDRTDDHIGNEISQVALSYQQSRILVNARKSELANWNQWCVIIDKVREKKWYYLTISVVQVLVPEDSVRRETQTLVVLIRRKGFVGGFKNCILI